MVDRQHAWRFLKEFMGGNPASFPDADQLALGLLCNREARQQAFQDLRTAVGVGHFYPNTLTEALCKWVTTRPVPGAADALLDELSLIALAARGTSQNFDKAVETMHLAEVAVRLEPPSHQHSRSLLQEVVRLREAQVAGGSPRSDDLMWTELDSVGGRIAEALLPHLDLKGQDAQLLEQCMWLFTGLPSAGHRNAHLGYALKATVKRWVMDPGAREGDARMLHVLREVHWFSGMDHFLGACRQLARFPKVKPPLSPNFEVGATFNPVAWAVWVLVHMDQPDQADMERAGELSTIAPEVLVTAALFAPAWAALAEPHAAWPGLAAACRWLKTHGETGHWRDYRPGARGGAPLPQEEEPEGADREQALAIIAQMGEQRYLKLLKHPVAKSKYKDGLFYMEACRGENAADVEAGFVKRNRTAVRALGLLPDEGDILQRYLALRRFAKEARQFGAQRQASELQLAQEALSNLAITAGYNDAAQLEWAMEAQLAQEVDPSSRRWHIGDYTVYIEPDEKANIVTEKDDARLKSMPDTIRKAPEYAEIKEARELLKGQWDRVRRRLEVAMATGEVMDRQAFLPALTTPAGKAMVPALVLRCTVNGATVDLLNFRTLSGEAVDPAGVDTFRVAHPLELGDTVAAWQSRLKAQKLAQPFEQLARKTYAQATFRGRQVRLGTFKEQLKRRGWKMEYEGDLTRRVRAGAHATITFTDGAGYQGALEILTLGDLQFRGYFSGLDYSEVCRDIDLASVAAAADKSAEYMTQR